MSNLGDSYINNLKNILDNGYTCNPRGSEIKELLGSVIEGKADENQIISYPGIRDVSDFNTNPGKYLESELLWYFSGSNSPEFISLFGSMWDRIKSADNTLNSNYGRSVFYDSIPEFNVPKFDWVINAFKKDKDTRQAIIPYTNEKIYLEEFGKDFTCTQLQHFFIRENKLHSIVYIRSSDSILGLNFDIPFWSIVCQLMREYLVGNYYVNNKLGEVICDNLGIGNLKVFIGSSHIYSNHYSLCRKLCEFDKRSFKSIKVKTGVAFSSLKDNKEINDVICYDYCPEILKWAGKNVDDSTIRIISASKHVKDGEKDYLYRKESIFNSSRIIMRIFRNAYNYALDEFFVDSGVRVMTDDKIRELKEIMTKYVNIWFNYYFEIV